MDKIAANFGRYGLYLQVIAVAALFHPSDRRPGPMRELARPSNFRPN